MHNLEKWIAAYIAMDDRRRREMLMFAEDTAATYPGKKTTRLSLVADNSLSGGVRLNLGEPGNALAPLGIGKVVKLK